MDEFIAIKKKVPPASTAPSITEIEEKATPEAKGKTKPKVKEKAKTKVKEETESKAQETRAHNRKSGRSYCALSALRGKLVIGKKGLMFNEANTNVSLRIFRVDNTLAATITDKMLLCTEALFYLDEKSLGAAALTGMDTGSYQHVGEYDAMRHIPLPEEGQMRISGRVLSLAEDHFRIRIGNNRIAGKKKSVPRIKVSSAPPSDWEKDQWVEETLIRTGSKWHLKT